MNVSTRWTRLFAPSGIFASLLGTKRRNRAQAKEQIQQWENEGGNLAPTPGAPDTLVTTPSA